MMEAGLRGGVAAQAGCYPVGAAVLPGKVLSGRRLPVSAGVIWAGRRPRGFGGGRAVAVRWYLRYGLSCYDVEELPGSTKKATSSAPMRLPSSWATACNCSRTSSATLHETVDLVLVVARLAGHLVWADVRSLARRRRSRAPHAPALIVPHRRRLVQQPLHAGPDRRRCGRRVVGRRVAGCRGAGRPA
jgi:hypothetical protein